MSAREEILGRTRHALAGAEVPLPELPRRPTVVVDDLDGLFCERVEDYRAVVVRVEQAGLPAAVARALDGIGSAVVPDGLPAEWLADVTTRIIVDSGANARALDDVGAVVTGAALGIATTGTIVLDHGPDQGRRALSLVPDVHVCVVRASQLVAGLGDAVDRLADAVASGRPLTWISGPSATSDIELERVEGVHGPRQLTVVLVADSPSSARP